MNNETPSYEVHGNQPISFDRFPIVDGLILLAINGSEAARLLESKRAALLALRAKPELRRCGCCNVTVAQADVLYIGLADHPGYPLHTRCRRCIATPPAIRWLAGCVSHRKNGKRAEKVVRTVAEAAMRATVAGLHEAHTRIDYTAEGLAADCDRRWFEQHPRRTAMLRECRPGEALWAIDSADDSALIVAVEQAEPGFRFRYFVAVKNQQVADDALAAYASLQDTQQDHVAAALVLKGKGQNNADLRYRAEFEWARAEQILREAGAWRNSEGLQ